MVGSSDESWLYKAHLDFCPTELRNVEGGRSPRREKSVEQTMEEERRDE